MAPDAAGREPRSIQTDAELFQLAFSHDIVRVTITASYTNMNDASVFVVPCVRTFSRFQLEKLVGGTWKRAFEPICTAGGSAPIEVKPGERHRDTLPVESWRRADIEPRFEVEPIPGKYRLVYDIVDSYDSVRADIGRQLPKAERISNDFLILD